MSNPSGRIIEQVPMHYREYASGFILFMQKYYDWLYRDSGFSKEEVEDLRTDTSWMSKDVDKFLSQGLLKYTDGAQPNAVDRAIVELSAKSQSGAISDSLPSDVLMEEVFLSFMTADGEYFTDDDDMFFETPKKSVAMIDSWFKLMGSTKVQNNPSSEFVVDEVLMISLLKHLHAIKGTEKSMKLFFNLFFDENITVYYPKFDIAIIDDNWVLDSIGTIRDDYYYNEYSYVLRVENDPDDYTELFEKVYMKQIHPAGFKVFLEQT